VAQCWLPHARHHAAHPNHPLAAAVGNEFAVNIDHAHQMYLALPMQASMLAPGSQSLLVAAMFALSGFVAIAGQLRIKQWFAARWEAGRSLVVGAMILAVSFVPLTVVPDGRRLGTAAGIAALLLTASLLAVASAAIFPNRLIGMG